MVHYDGHQQMILAIPNDGHHLLLCTCQALAAIAWHLDFKHHKIHDFTHETGEETPTTKLLYLKSIKKQMRTYYDIYMYTYLIIHIYIYIRIGMGDFNNRHVHSSNKTWEFTPAKPDRTKTRMKSWIWWTDYRGRQERDSTDKEWIPEWDSSMKNGGSMRKKLAISEQPAIMVFQTKCSSNELSNIPQSMAKHGPILQTIIPLHLCLSDRQGTVAVLPLAGLFDNLWSVFGLRQLRLALVRGRSPIVTVVTFGQHFILACWIFVLRVTTCRFSRKTLAGGILMATQFVGAYAPSIFEFNTCEASTRKRVNSLSWKANENNKLEFFWRRWCWVRLARSRRKHQVSIWRWMGI